MQASGRKVAGVQEQNACKDHMRSDGCAPTSYLGKSAAARAEAGGPAGHVGAAAQGASGSSSATDVQLDSATSGPADMSASSEEEVYRAPSLARDPALPWRHPTNVENVLTTCWCILCHLLLTGWPYCLLAIAGAAWFYTPPRYMLLALYGTLVLPRFKHTQHAVDVLDRNIFRHWRRYVSYSVTYSSAIDRNQQYIFAQFPHGAYPMGGQLYASVFYQLHARAIDMMAANVLFWVPVWRHYMSIGGAVTASPTNFKRTLQEGRCVSVHVGGIAEMFNCERDREVIVLRARLGFVRIAVEHGVALVPVYHFGNSRLIDFGPWWLRNVSRKLQMSLGIMCGRFGLPIPRQVPVWTVAGAPVPVGPPLSRTDPKFRDVVQDVHKRFTRATEGLYEKHRGQYWDSQLGSTWAARPLHIL